MGQRTIVMLVVLALALSSFGGPWGGVEVPSEIGRTNTVAPVMEPMAEVEQLLEGAGEHFVENLGQVENAAVRYYSHGDELSVGFSNSGMIYTLRGQGPERGSGSDTFSGIDPVALMCWYEGANDVEPRGVGPQGHSSNFFTGSDPSRWVRHAPSFSEVRYDDLYDGVDLRFYFMDGKLKYDLILDAGADPDRIVFRYDGAEGLGIDPATGDLLIHTSAGLLRDTRPVVFQCIEDGSNGIGAGFEIISDTSCRFMIPTTIDPNMPMVIDPGLEFSTYLGGSSEEKGMAIDVDGEGNIYIAGETSSSDFPMTSGAYAEDPNGNFDLFVSKIDPTGSRLLFSTYIGGSSSDYGKALRIASDDGIYITGDTNSDDFPTTDDAYDMGYNGGRDIILVKLSNTGSDLLYSTYFGGSQLDVGVSLVTDNYGCVFISGYTKSDDLPTTANAFCNTYNGPEWVDLFILKMNLSLSELIYCTYIGGYGGDLGSDILVDSLGNAYVVGMTNSTDFPVTVGAYCMTIHPDSLDIFVLKLTPQGSDLSFSTFLGGSGDDYGRAIEIADNGSVYIVGSSQSNDFPLTPNAIKTTWSSSEAILTVLDSTGSSLEFSTFLGGSGVDRGRSLAWSVPRDVIYVSGDTASQDLPATRGSFDSFNRGEHDIFVMGINTTDPSISYCTYIGGEMDDETWSHGLASDSKGDLCLVGWTWSRQFPTTEGAYANYSKGYWDVCIIKIDPEPCDVPSAPTGLTAESHVGFVSLQWDAPGIGNSRVLQHYVYKGDALDNATFLAEAQSFYNHVDNDVFGGMRYYYWVSAVNSAGEGALSESVWAVPVGPPSVPRNLRASTGNGTVTLNWTVPEPSGGIGISGYRILRGLTRDTLELVVILENVTSYVDSEVQIGIFYYYAVQAFNSLGNSTLSDNVRIKPIAPPSPPRSFSVTPGDGDVKLTWDLPSETGGTMLLGFYVYRLTGGQGMALIATMGTMTLGHIDSDVVNGRMYTYYVTAFSNVGESPPTTPLDAIPFGLPGEPLDLQAEAEDGEVTLTWGAPLSDGGSPITRYIIYWGTAPGNLENVQTIGNITSFEHTGLTNGMTYYYQVLAHTEAGDGPVSIVVYGTPMGLPGLPTGFTATSVTGGVLLRWTPPADRGGDDEVDIRILRGTTPDPQETLVEIADFVEFKDTDVEGGVTYYYRLQALNSLGAGPSTAILEVTVMTAPGQVLDLVATAANGRVELGWSAPVDDGGSPILNYAILRGIFETGLAEIGRVDGMIITYTDDTAENGKSYFYKVYALNTIGAGTRSESVPATPRGPPPAPGVLEAKVKGGNIVLTWTAPTAGNTAPVTGYKIYRGESEFELVLLEEVGLVNSYTDDDVKANKPYYYKVVATSDSGDGDMSRLAKGRVKVDEGPGFGGIAGILALGTAITLVSLTRRKRG